MSGLGSVIILSVLAGIVGGGLVYTATGRGRLKPPDTRRAILVGALAFVVALVGLSLNDSVVQVEAGTVSVVKQFGDVWGVFEPGLSFKLPFIQETIVYRTQELIYETREEILSSERRGGIYLDSDVDTATSDGQQISARFTVRFRIDGRRATYILENLGTEQEVVDKVIKANARVRVRNILKRFAAADLYSGNVAEAEEAITEQLQTDYAQEGIELIFFGLRSIGFTDDYKNAVEEKQIEAERIKTKENQAEQAKFDKQRIITEAEAEAERQRLERIGVAQGEAEATKLQAEAEAGAILLKAQAQADANKLIAASLTPEMISWQATTNWNGQYPTVLGGGGQFILPGDLFAAPQE